MMMIVIIIASYMDDDDRIVYGWDFSVTQQEQEQQDKRILGVRMFIVYFVISTVRCSKQTVKRR